MMDDPVVTPRQLQDEIEAMFTYSGDLDRAVVAPVWAEDSISPETYALRGRGKDVETRLLTAMRDEFARAHRTLGPGHGIIWRRTPFLVTEDDGAVVLRMRAALIDEHGQIDVTDLPIKHNGATSRSID